MKDNHSSPNYLERQIYEIISLRQIYSLPGEFTMNAPVCKDDIEEQHFWQLLNNAGKHEKENFSYCITLIDVVYYEQPLQLLIDVPRNYPDSALKVTLLHLLLPPYLKKALLTSIQLQCSNMIGEECMYQVVREAHDQALAILLAFPSQDFEWDESSGDTVSHEEKKELSFHSLSAQSNRHNVVFPEKLLHTTEIPILGRRLCYSHHIRASNKRRCIINWAIELQLGGFSKIGYPGVIIVEGPEQGCFEYINRLQRLRWKHFVCRGEDIQRGTLSETVDSMRKLPRGFLELGPDGMRELAEACKVAGLEDLFLTCMKIYRPTEEKSSKTSLEDENVSAKKGKKKKSAGIKR